MTLCDYFPAFPLPFPSDCGYGVREALKLPQRARAEPGRQMHFSAFQFQIIAFGHKNDGYS